MFDKEAMNSIRSFLHLAPLQKLYFRIEDDEVLAMYKRIKKAVFQFLKRLTRTKESAVSELISKITAVFADYKFFL